MVVGAGGDLVKGFCPELSLEHSGSSGTPASPALRGLWAAGLGNDHTRTDPGQVMHCPQPGRLYWRCFWEQAGFMGGWLGRGAVAPCGRRGVGRTVR